MTSEPEKLLPVIQADREAAASIVYPWNRQRFLDGGADASDTVQAFARHRGDRETGAPCEACGKPVEVGQVVLCYDDAGEMHADCEHPFALDYIRKEGEPEPVVLLGSPMRHIALSRLSSPVSGTEMVMVPREMTQAMLDATCATAADDERMRAVWEDLLYAAKAASPPTPVEASERGGRALFEHEMQQRRIVGEDADWANVDSDERALWTASANAVIAALSASPTPPIPMIAEAGERERDAPTYPERLTYEERILAAEMQVVAAQRALIPFATKACGWEQNHPGYHGTDSKQISHRLGDFRAARTVLTKIDAYLAGYGA